MKKKLILLLLFLALPVMAENNINILRRDGKVFKYYAGHITTKTTTNVTTSDAYIVDVAICVTGAGTTQTLTIVNKESTAKTLYTAGTAIAVGNTYLHFDGVLMTSGIDIVTGGTTAGTQDVFITYLQ